MATKYNLKYFGLPALGEPVRMMLHLGKFDWDDEIVTGETWPSLKPNTKWGQVPVLTSPEGKEMTQSTAIVRYLGKKVSIDGEFPDHSDCLPIRSPSCGLYALATPRGDNVNIADRQVP
jgi:hypothetical protein